MSATRPYLRASALRPDPLLAEIVAGLTAPRKHLPCKLLYDARGSRLFERICELEEYYPTRSELEIMEQHADDMADLLGPACLLIEFGSGNSHKTRLLLDRLAHPAGYVPVDISRSQLDMAATALAQEYPEVPILPLCADYNEAFQPPAPPRRPTTQAVYFPGSTIGNFHPHEAERFLARAGDLVGPGGLLLIGVDLVKDVEVLHRAYNDSQGVTAAFNLNLLERLNHEFGADFPVGAFDHRAFYNERRRRMEMHLVSLDPCRVRLRSGAVVTFEGGESIHTENSYKYGIDDFVRLASNAGLACVRTWTDSRRYFSVHALRR